MSVAEATGESDRELCSEIRAKPVAQHAMAIEMGIRTRRQWHHGRVVGVASDGMGSAMLMRPVAGARDGLGNVRVRWSLMEFV